jgi:predicted aspartyl protease
MRAPVTAAPVVPSRSISTMDFSSPSRNTSMHPLSSTPSSSYDSIPSCKLNTVYELNSLSSHFRIEVNLRGGKLNQKLAAMVDSGATALFMGKTYADSLGICTFVLKRPIKVYNIDGTPNSAGEIQRFARLALTVDGYEHWVDFLITDLGGEGVILGLPWLRRINPNIDWEKGRLSVNRHWVSMEEIPDLEGSQVAGIATGNAVIEDPNATEPDASAQPTPANDLSDLPAPVRLMANCKLRQRWKREGVIDEWDEEVWCSSAFTYAEEKTQQKPLPSAIPASLRLCQSQNGLPNQFVQIAAGATHSQQFAEAAHKSKPTKSFEEMVPKPY